LDGATAEEEWSEAGDRDILQLSVAAATANMLLVLTPVVGGLMEGPKPGIVASKEGSIA